MLAVLGAMREEVSHLVEALDGATVERRGGRDFHRGILWGHDAVIVFSHWGKVASAMTATMLAREFGATRLIFTGVAGGIDPSLRVGDVVIANKVVHHDLDARPLFARHEIPLLGRTYLTPDPVLGNALVTATRGYLAQRAGDARVTEGLVASGDQFFASDARREALRLTLPDARCVEMEGASVAQVCTELHVPFAIVRTISDAAGDSAAHDFSAFLRDVASEYSYGILRRLLGA